MLNLNASEQTCLLGFSLFPFTKSVPRLTKCKELLKQKIIKSIVRKAPTFVVLLWLLIRVYSHKIWIADEKAIDELIDFQLLIKHWKTINKKGGKKGGDSKAGKRSRWQDLSSFCHRVLQVPALIPSHLCLLVCLLLSVARHLPVVRWKRNGTCEWPFFSPRWW